MVKDNCAVGLPIKMLNEIEKIVEKKVLGFTTIEEFVYAACRHKMMKLINEHGESLAKEISIKTKG